MRVEVNVYPDREWDGGVVIVKTGKSEEKEITYNDDTEVDVILKTINKLCDVKETVWW